MSKPQVRVTIETDKVVLKDLTPEQAKELRDILLQMFPVEPKVVREVIHERHPSWYYPWPTHWTISSSNTLTVNSSGGSDGSYASGTLDCSSLATQMDAAGVDYVTISLNR